jgi:elongation factor P
LKNAIVETGARVLVPLFIEPGEKIRINTEDGSYIERIK